jgi:hypothetical protein
MGASQNESVTEMRTSIGSAVKRLVPPKLLTTIQAARSRNLQVRWLKEHGVIGLAKTFLKAHGPAVLHGPFAGMKYPESSILSRHSIPMLLGSYESELHEVVASALSTQYDLIVDVGGAEGYYAVGFALKGKCPVVAYEADSHEREICRETAVLNRVDDRMTLRSWCSPEALTSLTKHKGCLIISDCEGYETQLFDDLTIRALTNCDILIETHGDSFGILHERFSRTHQVQSFTARERSAREYPELSVLGLDGERAVAEYRVPGQQWLFATRM